MRSLSPRSFFSTLILLATAGLVQAQTTDNQNQSPEVRHGFHFGVGVIGLDEDKALEQGVDDSATVLDIGYYATVGRNFAFIAGLTVPIIDDEDPFSQQVEDEWDDDVYWESSDIQAWGILLEGSARFPLNDTVSFGGAVGLRTLDASREISFCDDCYSEDIDLDGGAYLRPYVNIDTGRFAFEASYAVFMSGDYTNGPLANFIWSF